MRVGIVGVLVVALAGVAAPFAAQNEAPATLTAAAPEATVALDRAREAAAGLGLDLLARLSAELAAGGPVSATRDCAEVAPALAAAHSRDGLTVYRVSARPRNPAGRPDPWEAAELERLAAQLRAGEMPADSAGHTEDGPVLRYLKPLRIVTPCLRCHGDPATFSPELTAALAERYPADEGVGYREGDLRGAISVTVPLTAATAP